MKLKQKLIALMLAVSAVQAGNANPYVEHWEPKKIVQAFTVPIAGELDIVIICADGTMYRTSAKMVPYTDHIDWTEIKGPIVDTNKPTNQ